MAGETGEQVGCGLGFPGDRVECFRVGTEHVEPVGQVLGVVRPWGGGDAEDRAGERGGEFGDEFFDGVGVLAVSAGEITGETLRMAGPVNGSCALVA